MAKNNVIRTIELACRYGVNVDYEINYSESNYDDYHCDSTLSNVRVRDTNGMGINSINIIDTLKIKQEGKGKGKERTKTSKYEPTDIEKYCMARLMVIHGCNRPELYDVDVCNGYYGQEIGGITFEKKNDLLGDIRLLLNIESNREKVQFVLEKEYQFLLPELKPHTLVCEIIEDYPFKSIFENTDYFSRVKRNSIAEYNDMTSGETLPIGVMFEERLVDGYHRVAVSMSKGNTSGTFIRLSPPKPKEANWR